MDISIVIVNYKSKGLALNCIKSIKDSDFGNLKYEIIVVDNDSNDNIGEILAWQYPDVKFIQNNTNVGMGAGNNTGIRKAEGEYVAIMNPDTIVFHNTFQKLQSYMSAHPGTSMIGPKQYNPDKTVQDSCYRWYGLFTPLYRRTPLGRLHFAQADIDRFLMKDFDHNSTREVDWLMGSFLFARADKLKEVGGFDERFFLYFEDTDLAKKIWRKGGKVVYFPEVEIIHNHGRESARDSWYRFFVNRATRQHIISWIKYLMKWSK